MFLLMSSLTYYLQVLFSLPADADDLPLWKAPYEHAVIGLQILLALSDNIEFLIM